MRVCALLSVSLPCVRATKQEHALALLFGFAAAHLLIAQCETLDGDQLLDLTCVRRAAPYRLVAWRWWGSFVSC